MKDMSFVKTGLGCCAFLLAFFVFHTGNVQAAECTFDSTVAGNDFNLAANWTGCGGVAPTASDVAIVPAATSTTMTASSTVGALNATGTINADIYNLTVGGVTTIPAGGVVTSTSGTLTFTGVVSSTGSIGSVTGDMLFNALNADNQNNGTLDIGSGTATTTGNWINAGTGTIFGRGGTFSINGHLTNNGTFNAGTGTFRITGNASQTLTGGLLFNNFLSIKFGGSFSLSSSSTILGTLSMNGSGGTLNAGANNLTVVGVSTLSASTAVTSTSGLLTFTGAVSSTGAIGSVSGNMLFGSTLQNNGTFNVGSGTATTTGNLTSPGIINGGSGTLAVLASITANGTSSFNAQTGTLRFFGAAGQTMFITGSLNNVEVIKSAGGSVTLSAHPPTIGGTFVMSGGSVPVPFNVAALSLTVTGASTIGANYTVTSTSGTITLNGPVTSTGSIGSSSGTITLGSTLQNNGTFNVGSGTTVSVAANATSTGTINNGGGTLIFLGNFNNTGTYEQSGTTRFAGSSLQTLSGNGITFATLVLANTSGGVTTGVNVSSTSFTLSSGTLNLSGYRFAATSSFSNTGGYINVNSGTLVGAMTSSYFTDSAGTPVSSFTNPGSIYVTVVDQSRNLSATTTDAFSFSVAGNAASGADSETIGLVETAAASGIFRNPAALTLKYSGVATPGSSEFELNGTGSASYVYTDAYDASDTTSTSVTLTFAGAAAGSSSNSSSGGGGGGAGSSQALIPLVTTYQTLVTNLATLGIPVHALVKLPDDGNLSTQEDSAVYYIGTDGKRHAFPNSKVYFTWYADFSQVQVVNLSQLSSIPLGANVTYKPGARMVKFTTDPKVYAVDKGGVLRWIASEDLAIALYGTSWNMMIDDVSDAFYVNYTFGTNVNSTADFSVSGVSTVVYPD